MNRREWLESASLAAALGAVTASAAVGQESRPRAYAGAHQMKDLPFQAGKLEGISERMILSHHQNNYGGALRRLNRIEVEIAALPAGAQPFLRKGLKQEELIASNSVVLHEEYFGNLGGDGKLSGSLADALGGHFGSTGAWEKDFRDVAATLGGGSGWVILAMNFHDGTLHNYIAYDHTQNAAFGMPILVLDMYEHSYHLDYASQAARYVDAFMRNVQWDAANRRLELAQNILKTLGTA